MPYGILIGDGVVNGFDPGVAQIPIGSSAFLDGVTVDTNDDYFVIDTVGNYVLKTDIYIRGSVGAQVYEIELYNRTTDAVVQSFTTSAIGLGQVFESASFIFSFTVSDISHQYQLRLRLPESGPSPSVQLGIPGFKAELGTAAAGGGGGGGMSANETITQADSPRVITAADNGIVFDNDGATGAVDMTVDASVEGPLTFMVQLLAAQEMRVTSALTLRKGPGLTYTNNFVKSDPASIGTAWRVTMIGTTSRELLIEIIAGALSDNP